ncbi:MAG: hypothetical protein P8M50_03070 [Paracoccaceae bacterium]|nr:hypothetical protein [Paracoccaceae bacterium]
MNIVWGLYLFSLVSGLGFERSHSLTDLDEQYLLIEDCIKAANYMNALPFAEKQVGLDRGTQLRYVCVAKVSIGTNL